LPQKFSEARDPVSSYTHFIGAMLSAAGLLWLTFLTFTRPGFNASKAASVLIFGLSLVALYATSARYHYVKGTDRELLPLRKLDHAMIYVLIAGSYTPVLLTYFPQPKGYLFTAAIWGIAVAGILIKVCWFDAPRWLYTGLYLLMGWAIVFDLPALAAVPRGEIALLLAGGIFYTIGGGIYAVKKPNFSRQFGFHELFHIFVMLGSLMHFVGILLYVV